MNRRLDLHNKLIDILGTRGQELSRVYFQPPETAKMHYPCIVYSRSSDEVLHADNTPYFRQIRYQIKVIDPNPNSDIPDKVARLPMCKFDRHFTVDNLNHDVYNLYY